jgi:hypothetical protein
MKEQKKELKAILKSLVKGRSWAEREEGGEGGF